MQGQEAVDILLDSKNIDVDLTDKKGSTPYDLALDLGNDVISYKFTKYM